MMGLQEPVDPMKKEYKAAVNSQEELLGTEGTQKVSAPPRMQWL
jgi:hypothetical protein